MLGFKMAFKITVYSSETETNMFRQIKHCTFEFATSNKDLFVHFELNTLPSLLIFLCLFSVIVVLGMLHK